MDIPVLQAWLNMMAAAHLSRLELTCPDRQLRLVRRSEDGVRRQGGAAAGAESAATVSASAAGASVNATGAAQSSLRARAVGVFLDRHPLQETALTAPGRRVAGGEIVALLAVDTLFLPVVAEREGIIGEPLVEPGAEVDFGRELFTFVAQD